MEHTIRVGFVRRAGVAGCIFALVALAAGGCAYFNTLYNAKKLYSDASLSPKARDGATSSGAEDQYDKAIGKCEALIAAYPKSKYVDDAILLIGKCLYQKGEYDDAIVQFAELDTVSRDMEIKAEGRLYAARSYMAKDDIESAVPILKKLVDEKREKASDESLFLLGTALVKLGNEDEAVKYLEQLASQYPKSVYRVEADLETAEVYAERKEYAKSLAIYERLGPVRLVDRDRIRYLSNLEKLHVDMGEYAKAAAVFRELTPYVLDPSQKAANMLVAGRAYMGLDSLDVAIDTYKSVAVSYPRSVFSAEAHFRLGEIYQDKLDSLQIAEQQFNEVPGQYAGSPFADEAISRSSAISKLLKLRSSLESGAAVDSAGVEFDLAEIELFQFKNYDKSLEGYKKMLEKYPDNELAPRAAYAIAYIYDVNLGDAEKARQAYEHVVSRYPASQQAEFARQALTRLQTGQPPEQPPAQQPQETPQQEPQQPTPQQPDQQQEQKP